MVVLDIPVDKNAAKSVISSCNLMADGAHAVDIDYELNPEL
ncbi:hypothetical protein LCGC14_0380660 [marine sediment metagenome]|uniref:Uncharacterized protein n=1 Tax=marine sediment metagenome TaxID=412755 RepID=A0A0F9T2A1_9ZZZZ